MSAIELIDVTKTYAGTAAPAVQNLNLCLEKGAIISLLGPSGCGKSTTLRLIAGFERAEKGTIVLDGKIVSDENTWIPPEKRGVGMVFQDYALFPHLDVFNNIGFGYRGKDLKERVREVIALVNLQGYEKRYPGELSGGQQQRVALARALARRPVVVLLDEPFSNLDADLRGLMRREVSRIIKAAGATAVLVTHDQKDALAISDRIVVINGGVVEQVGTPREIYQFPETSFVATFVGQANILDGFLDGNGHVVTAIGLFPCRHTHGLPPGSPVKISVRPDSLELAKEGEIKGVIAETVYGGDTVEAVLELRDNQFRPCRLLVHLHPEEKIKVGEKASFKVLPDFVAVIKR